MIPAVASFAMTRIRLLRFAWFTFLVAATPVHAVEQPISFNRDVRPILSDRCFACHGPDAKTIHGGLRLDVRESAIQSSAIVPGNADESEMLRRIASTDPEEVMPPPEMHKPLEPRQMEILRRWILEGAVYQPHWAFAPLERPEVPRVNDADWIRNDIDRFVAAKRESEGIAPSAPADPVTLLRRLSVDLNGIPPTTDEVNDFIGNSSDDAYKTWIQHRLDSHRFGERMAIYWLDLVRYADTVGYHGDQNLSQSPYRDYVIDAFNHNMPYDQFVREQLAGDLLDTPTIEQKIASGYNRLNQTTEEGGSQAKEYLAIYFADRVRNVSQVFMGATVGCAQCHDHKYDPYTSKDFYSLGAFFADVEERGVYGGDGRPPVIGVPTPDQESALALLDEQLAKLDETIHVTESSLIASQRDWETKTIASSDQTNRDIESVWLDAGNVQPEGVPFRIAEILNIVPESRSAEQAKELVDFYLATDGPLAELRSERARLQGERDSIDASITKTVITRSVPPREIRILPRGNWMDETGQIVEPAIPEFLGTLATDKTRLNRLDLADWLCRNDNVLTARTMINRLWYLMIGRGICSSVDDLGGQGTFPSHPELLDYLAVEFIESGWDIKHMLAMITDSATYRQSSQPSPELRSLDPYNDFFARQGRHRVSAEMVRDTALAVSGLLVEQTGGPSVKPYQPEGYYDQLNFPRRVYMADTGASQYRRGVYTHWQRTFLHPMLKAFDAPSREECTAFRSRSNTPLQALTLLNDPSFVEAARVFAERIIREGGNTPGDRIAWAYQAAVSRPPDSFIVDELNQVFENHLAHYVAHPDQAAELVEVGDAATATEITPVELAAWTSVARVILNLNEVITRY